LEHLANAAVGLNRPQFGLEPHRVAIANFRR
jgi:hypothetical protein